MAWIMVSDFLSRKAPDERMVSSLTVQDKKIAASYKRMKVRGKKGRTVPTLITVDVEQSLELNVRYLREAGIYEENDFLFALPGNVVRPIKTINACAIIRKFADACGAKDPQSLRGKRLRKHMASICIPMELSDNAVSEVCDFTGHHEKVHRKFYRKNPIIREVVHMVHIVKKTTATLNMILNVKQCRLRILKSREPAKKLPLTIKRHENEKVIQQNLQEAFRKKSVENCFYKEIAQKTLSFIQIISFIPKFKTIFIQVYIYIFCLFF